MARPGSNLATPSFNCGRFRHVAIGGSVPDSDIPAYEELLPSGMPG